MFAAALLRAFSSPNQTQALPITLNLTTERERCRHVPVVSFEKKKRIDGFHQAAVLSAEVGVILPSLLPL